MKVKSILLFICFIFYNFSFSNDSLLLEKETMVRRGLKGADIIFYGRLIKVDTIVGSCDFEILELFKGNYQSKTIKAVSNREKFFVYPFKSDLWIVYAEFNKDKTISLDMRSPTQTMEIPAGFPPPIPYLNTYGRSVTKIDSLNNKIDNLKIKNETLYTFFYQLEQLRAYKSAQNTISQKEKEDSKLINYTKYISIFLIVIIVLLLILIFAILKKKK